MARLDGDLAHASFGNFQGQDAENQDVQTPKALRSGWRVAPETLLMRLAYSAVDRRNIGNLRLYPLPLVRQVERIRLRSNIGSDFLNATDIG